MRAKDPLRHILSTCAAQALAFSPAILSPLTVGGLINGLQIGEVEAGSLVNVEFLVMGITSILVAPVSVRIPYRLLALAGGILLLAGHAGAATAAGLDELYPWRITAGMGCGCLAAAVNAARLLLLTDVPGVLDREGQLVDELDTQGMRRMMDEGVITGGMIPKLETCLNAVDHGVEAAVILDGRVPHALLLEIFTDRGIGTLIRNP